MNVVHFSKTPLAGSPIRIVRALNAHTDVKARLIVGNPGHYGERAYEGDLDWQRDRDEAMAAIEAADVLHLHRYMDLDQMPFGLDFHAYARRGKVVLRQFHESQDLMARRNAQGLATLGRDPFPQLVIAQYHERFYPRARVVPNLVPIRDPLYRPLAEKPAGPVRFFFAPSVLNSAWSSRWETKGYPETRRLLRRVARATGAVADVRTGAPLEDCLRARQASHVAVDELVTGSYHLSSLESLAQGVPTLAFLDQRVLWTLAEFTGTSDHPWVNCRLEEAEEPLRRLAQDRELREEVGRHSRDWMEKHWDDRALVQHYVSAYRDAVERPDRFGAQRFDPSDPRALWRAQGADDAVWRARRDRQASVFRRLGGIRPRPSAAAAGSANARREDSDGGGDS